MKFRFHLGGYNESMETTCEVDNIDSLRGLVKKFYKNVPFDKLVDIDFEYCGFDDRNGWDTYYVIAILHPSGRTVVGMSDGKFENANDEAHKIQ